MTDTSISQPQPAAPAADTELRSFLDDYDRQTATESALAEHARLHPSAKSEIATEPEAFSWEKAELDSLREAREADAAKIADSAAQLSELSNAHSATSAELQSIKHQQFMAEERADFDKLEARISDISNASNLPEGFAKRWLLSEGMMNPAVRDAFDNRRQNPAAWTRAERQITKEFSKIAPPIDKEVTGDRTAVADIMRRGSSSRAPESPPPSFGKMSNSEFNTWVKDHMGFHPGV